MKAISHILEQGAPLNEARHALILLHGRGGTAEGIISLADKLVDESFFVAAPEAMNNIWYPYSFLEEEKRNEPFLTTSVNEIKALIDRIKKSLPEDKIFIAGFSQGACLTLEVSARFPAKYGGLIAFTGGLIGREIDEDKYRGDFKRTKVLITNGDDDPYIPLKRSEASKDLMEKLGADVSLKVYKGRPHIVSHDEVQLARSQILNLA